ncbi:MAG: InlB B-repeat-containing protein [Bacteroidales bacterium]|nr:InlB B-repeat-containing protein [Bacteroidales bacterium]
MNALRNIFLLLALALWGGAMAVASPAGDYDPTLPPEPYALYQVNVSCDSVGLANLTGTGRYKRGTRVWINASSRNADYTFAYWMLNGERYDVSTSGFYYTVTAETADFVAHFEYNPSITPEDEYNPSLPVEPTYQEPVVVIPTYPLYLVCSPSDAGSFNRTSGARVEAGTRVTCTVYPKQNFNFLGWYDSAGTKLSSTRSFTYTMGNASTTLTARLEYNPTMPADPSTTQPEVDNNGEKRYAVRVGSAGHGTVSISPLADSLVVGNDVTLTATPDEHYHFSHWSDGSRANPYTFQVSRNDSLTAYFAINQHLLTYTLDGEIVKSMTLDYGAAITPEPAPEREHHHFTGWHGIPADLLMPDHDVTVCGNLAVDTFALIYLVDDVLFRTDQVAYGTEITLAEVPEREGYTFSGWCGYPTDRIMPDHDVTISGTFTKKVVITDGEVYDAEEEEHVDILTYTRTFPSADKWQALYVPFSIPIDTLDKYGLQVAELNDTHMYDIDEDGVFDQVTLEFLYVKHGATDANYPYLIRSASAGEITLTLNDVELQATAETELECSTTRVVFKIRGTYEGISGKEMYNNNYYAMGGGTLVRMTNADSGLKPQRWYLWVENKNGEPEPLVANAARLRIFVGGEEFGEYEEEESETAIQNLVAPGAIGHTIHTLDGRTVNRAVALPSGLYIKNHQKMFVR